jgi:hypothetical protein
MSLRIRRGTTAQRTGITFDLGEIVYTTDTQKLYIGDGVTAGGKNLLETSAGNGFTFNQATQQIDFSIGNLNLNTAQVTEDASRLYYTDERAQDAVAAALVAGNAYNTGITFTYNDALNRITAVSTGGLTNISADTNPSLGGNLSTGSYNITGNGSISASSFSASSSISVTAVTQSTSYTTGALTVAGGVGISKDLFVHGVARPNSIILDQDLTTGGLTIETNSGGSTSFNLFTLNSYTADPIAPQIFYSRSRGTKAASTPLQPGDEILNVLFLGRTQNGTADSAAGQSIVAGMGAYIAGTVSEGIAPGALVFGTADLTGAFAPKLTIGPDGKHTFVAPALTAGVASGQVNSSIISTWMKVTFNGVNYAIPMYSINA